MKDKKTFKKSSTTFFLIGAIIVIIVMTYYIYSKKTNYNKELSDLETNSATMQNTTNEEQEKINSKSNTISSEKVSHSKNDDNNEIASINNTLNNNRNVEYEFTSADQAAAKGYPKILKIFELNENELEFEYNSAFDFIKSTLDSQVLGIARTNAEQLYEFEETVNGHQYKLVFEFNNSKDTVTIYEYDNGNEIGFINLFR